VRTIDARPGGATMQLALQPEMAEKISADTTAMLLPKSLFGDQFVSLQMPQDGDGPLKDGDVIHQDTSKQAVQVEEAINNLMPVLQAVQPQKLSSTLNAVATALQGRGPQIGATVAQLNSYLKQLNPELPDLTHDLGALAKVSNTYADALPDVVKTLHNLTTTSKTVAEQAQNLSTLYGTVTNTSQNLQQFLAANENNLIRLGASSKPTLKLLQKYAPEYPCFVNKLASLVPRADRAFGKGTNEPGLHIRVEIVVNRGKYEPGVDTPKYADKRGPRCYNVSPSPNPFPQTPPDGAIKDGSSQPPAARSRNDGPLPAGNSTAPQSAPAQSSLPNSPQEQHMIAALIGPAMNKDPKNVPDWSSLLMGPLMRGAEVSVK
jgi:virulence factor Mce-like protein